MPDPGQDAASACPTCGKALDAKDRCWKCCDRLCAHCGLLTGSAFIALCILCGRLHPDPPVSPAERKARQWVVVVEPVDAGEPGEVPVETRVKRSLKYMLRCQGLRCVKLPHDPPAGAERVEL